MKIDKHSARRLSLACLLLLAACKKVEPEDEGSGAGDCQGDACASSAPAVDWAGKNPTYSAHVVVVDTAGDPVKDATVKVGDKSVSTDKDGRAVIGPLDAVEVATLSVEKDGATPQITKATAFSSAQTTQEVTVAPLDVDKMVDVQKTTTADVNGAHLDVPARALATEDGTRAKNARMQLTYFSGTESNFLLPGDGAAVNEQGAATAMGALGGLMYVRFDDEFKRPLNLAPGQSAVLELPIADTFPAREGQTIPLWSLDEVNGQWKKESSCLVSTRTVAGQPQLFCTGSVDHFSYWGYAREIDIYKPGTIGCVNSTARAEAEACFKVSVLALNTFRCDAKGERCERFYFGREQFFQVAPDVAWCGVMTVDNATYRIETIYDTDPSGCPEEDRPAAGRRSKVSDAINLQSFKEALGSEVMLNFTLNGDRDCPTLCAQVPLTITRKDLDGSPWTDRDNDGYYASTDQLVQIPYHVDCNDDRRDIHPYASEPFCVVDDRNCDGKVNTEVKKIADLPYYRWNWECRACKNLEDVKLPLTDEVAMNYYDENCDGVVGDMDGDGQDWPKDCNDYNRNAYQGATEVPGNWTDEDCDGLYVDADGDGLYNPYHIHLAEPLGLDIAKFTDCNDYDERVNPTIPVKNEAALKGYYYQSGTDVRRAFYYCSLFEQEGVPSYLYYNIARDLNCDGIATDLDGDGYAAPGDLTLGEAKATDCDDHDPRIHPVSDIDATCTPPAKLVNDSVCNIPSRVVGEGCPILTLAGTDVVTHCEETKDQAGNPTGLGVCSFPGWWDGNPLVINPGSPWGPCDGELETQPLPDCPAGASCGGPLPYTAAFQKYIEKTYLMSMPVMFKGMCFPACDITK